LKDFLTICLAKGEPCDLIETLLLRPFHTPEIHVRFTLGVVNDSFHRELVIDSVLPDVIPHGLRHMGNRYFEQLGKPFGSLRMKPHENGKAINRFPTKS
jgi:hypothetical protein